MSTPISSAGGRIVICPVDRSKDTADPSLEKAARIRRVDERLAAALALPSLERKDVADHLAQIAGLSPPTRQEAEDLLVGVLLHALGYINPDAERQNATWAEVANGGLQPLYDISRRADSTDYLARCATDLGLSEKPEAPNGELSPGELVQRLNAAIEDDLLGAIILRLRAAGISDMTAPR